MIGTIVKKLLDEIWTVDVVHPPPLVGLKEREMLGSTGCCYYQMVYFLKGTNFRRNKFSPSTQFSTGFTINSLFSQNSSKTKKFAKINSRENYFP